MIAMLRHGIQSLRMHKRLVVSLYLVEFAAAQVVTLSVAWTLGSVFGHRPVLARAADGDVAALLAAARGHGGLITALWCGGLAVAVGYALLSWYLTAGLIGALTGRRFGETAGARFYGFAKLWLCALIPVVLGLVALAVGLEATRDRWREAETIGALVRSVGGACVPGALLLGAVFCAVDYARILLVEERTGSSFKAFLWGFRMIFRHPLAIAHYGVFVLLWVGISVLYVAMTAGRPFDGVAGAVVLFGVRQATLFLRFGARVATTAGQVALVTQVSSRS